MMLSTCSEKAAYFRSTLGMLEDDKNKPVVIVESKDDERALGRILNGIIIPVYDASECSDPGFEVRSNKELVIEAAQWMKSGKAPPHNCFIGIVDADYERADFMFPGAGRKGKPNDDEEQREKYNVFTTDWHDLDVHVFWETALGLIRTKLNAERYGPLVNSLANACSDWCVRLMEAVLDKALTIGLVRFSLHRQYISQKHVGKKLSDYKYVDTQLNIDIDGILSDAARADPRFSYSDLVSQYNKTRADFAGLRTTGSAEKTQYVINGHDLMLILALCIIGVQGNDRGTISFAEHVVPRLMRESYSKAHFMKTRLSAKLSKFSDNLMRLFC